MWIPTPVFVVFFLPVLDAVAHIGGRIDHTPYDHTERSFFFLTYNVIGGLAPQLRNAATV